ncbi:MAG TPA: T9SS type A sorting domain-containing protein [Chitinophagales bacterium]|nr:T9SS type A sorting domain-containing protein [Chitinophagales bacterium]HRH55128.1 T9SS type A sorting domain-containing protein [Chitinophagales bacterium]
MTTPNRYHKLKAYSLFSTAFLINGPSGFSQVVYVDIDPDIILDTPGEQFTLDIDGNGSDDISFFNSSFDFYMATPWWSYWTRQDIVAYLPDEKLELAGLKHYVYYWSQNFYYPYALSNNVIIKDDLNFNDASFQAIAERTYYQNHNDLLFCNHCYWYNYFTDESVNKFLGFKLKDDASDFHYGWIRCDVLDEGRTMIIKDYAYELTPDNPILAGDTAHYIGLSTQEEKIDPVVYCENKKVYISNLDKNCDVSIYNLNGGIIINKEVKTGSVEFDLQNVATGAYLVVFKNKNEIRSKKIIID